MNSSPEDWGPIDRSRRCRRWVLRILLATALLLGSVGSAVSAADQSPPRVPGPGPSSPVRLTPAAASPAVASQQAQTAQGEPSVQGLSGPYAWPSSQSVEFERISLDQGLSSGTVLSMLQDSMGYMWFGTIDGLNKYDGYSFTVFRSDPNNEHSLADNLIRALAEDQDGAIWVGTETALHRYDRQTGQFTRYPMSGVAAGVADNPVLALLVDHGGTLWVGGGQGLYHFDKDSEQFVSHRRSSTTPGGLNDLPVYAIYMDAEDTLWIGARRGLYGWPKESQRIRYYRPDLNALRWEHNTVQSIAGDEQGNLWIGTAGGGLFHFEPEVEGFTHYVLDPHDVEGLTNNKVYSTLVDQEGVVWVGTLGGLYRLDPKALAASGPALSPQGGVDPNRSGALTLFQAVPGLPTSLSSNYVLSMYEGDPAVLWIGTSGGGISKFDTTKKKFLRLPQDLGDLGDIVPSVVLAILEDSRGLLWIGTEGDGLHRYDRVSGQWHRYLSPTPEEDQRRQPAWGEEPGSDQGLQLEPAPNPPVSRGTGDEGEESVAGSESLQMGSTAAQTLVAPGLPGDYIIGLVEDREGNIWIGVWDEGLCRCDPELASCACFRTDPLNRTTLSSNIAVPLYQDSTGSLWIGTRGRGLDRLDNPETADPISAEFVHYLAAAGAPNRLSDNQVSALVDDGGKFWLGTLGGGLNLFDPATGQFRHWRADPDRPGSLSSDAITSVLLAHDGVLWLGTDQGLNRFDPETDSFTNLRRQDNLPDDLIMGILEDDQGYLWLSSLRGLGRYDPATGSSRNYALDEGLQGYEYTLAGEKGRDGTLYFGGINGLNVVDARAGTPASPPPPVVLTALSQEGRDIGEPGSLEVRKQVTLHWPDNSFEFEFAALAFSRPERAQYAYFLEPFDQDWSYTGSRRFGRYTNLPGGSYVLHLKAANADGVWNEAGTSLAVTVVPPFWQTRWFQLLALLILAAAVAGGYRLRVRSIEARSKELEAQVAARTREIEQRRQELEALYRADEELYGYLQLEQVLQSLVDIAVDFLHADKSCLLCWNEAESHLHVLAARGFSAETIDSLVFAREEGLVGYVAQTGEPAIVEDAQLDPRRGQERREVIEMVLNEGIRSFMLLPISVNGNAFGVFNVSYTQPHAFGEEEQRLFTALAQRTGLAVRNAQAFTAEQKRSEQFRVIGEVSSQITAMMTVRDMLERLAELIRNAFDYYHVGIGLVEGDEVVYRVGAGQLWESRDFKFKPARLAVGQEGLSGWVAARGQPVMVPDVRTDRRYVWMEGSRTRSEVVVPIMIKGRVIGVLDVQSDKSNAFDDTDLKVLQSLAHQAGAAIENTQLYERAQLSAKAEERSRLARDLHDAVTQTLFSASLLAEVLPATWQVDQEEGQKLLQELRQLSRGALAEMRTLLLELRPTVLAEADLGDLFRQLSEAVTGRTGIPVELTIEGDCELPEDVRLAFYRIAQEALNNVVKHARATKASIRLYCAPIRDDRIDGAGRQQAELTIADNGVGFDPALVPPDHLGLRIIRERAEAIGAKLLIDSSPGRGTRVSITWRPPGSLEVAERLERSQSSVPALEAENPWIKLKQSE